VSPNLASRFSVRQVARPADSINEHSQPPALRLQFRQLLPNLIVFHGPNVTVPAVGRGLRDSNPGPRQVRRAVRSPPRAYDKRMTRAINFILQLAFNVNVIDP
jgi:hypothetical protein